MSELAQQLNKFEEGAPIQNTKKYTHDSASEIKRYSRNNVQIAFIKFTIKQKDDKEVTFYSSTHTVKGNSGKSRPDYILSLKHQRFAEKANVGTIEIVYVPQGTQNPNMVEEAMAKSDNGHCEIQYGNEGYTSRVYRGMITDYRTTLDNGYLRYSIDFISESAFSTLLTIRDERCNVPASDEESLKKWTAAFYSDLVSLNGGGYLDRISQDVVRRKILPLDEDIPNGDIEKYTNYIYYEYDYSDPSGSVNSIQVRRVNPIDEDTMSNMEDENLRLQNYVTSNYVLITMWYIVNRYLKDSYEFDIKHSDKGFENPKRGVYVIGENPLKALKTIASSLRDLINPNLYS